MNAANDTAAPTTLARGCTVQSKAWRAHRFDSHIRITSLANAGKRGKVCAVFEVCGSDNEAIEPVAPFIFAAVQADLSVESMERTLRDVGLAGLRFERREAKGVHIDARPTLRIDSDFVSAEFTGQRMVVTFTAIYERKPSVERRFTQAFEAMADGRLHESLPAIMSTAFRQDTHVGCDARDAAKAYVWAQKHLGELPRMTLQDFRAAMDSIGVSLS